MSGKIFHQAVAALSGVKLGFNSRLENDAFAALLKRG